MTFTNRLADSISTRHDAATRILAAMRKAKAAGKPVALTAREVQIERMGRALDYLAARIAR